MTIFVVALVGVVSLIFLYWRRKAEQSQEQLAKELIKQAEHKAAKIIEQAKLDAKQVVMHVDLNKSSLEKEARELAQKEELIEREKAKLKTLMQDLEKREKKLQQDLIQYSKEVSLTADEARKMLFAKAEAEIEADIASLYQQKRHDCEQQVERYQHSLVIQTLSRLPQKVLHDASISEVSLPSEEIKAKIIGREGKNIKAFQQLTGVTLVVDETPEVITLSSFDLERRELAKIALEELIKDGRITQGRIEEEVQKAKSMLDKQLVQYGQKAVDVLHLHGVHPSLLLHLGRLQLRTSLGQNLLEHSIEVAQIMGLLAAELKLNISKAMRMGLLHDIGKAVTQDTPLSHALSGYRLCLDANEPEEIANGVGCHHDEMPASSLEAQLVKFADYLSGARRGARAGNSDSYFKRLEDFEALAKSFPGVKTAFSVSSGRELQVFVRPEVIDDTQAHMLAKQIAEKAKALSPTHRIQISVIRETKAVEYTHSSSRVGFFARQSPAIEEI